MPKPELTVVSSLDADLAELIENRNAPLLVRCSVALALRELPEATVTLLNEAIKDEKVKGARIATILQKHGHPVRQNAVQRHRRHECRCEG